MEADVCECRQLEKYFRNELAQVKYGGCGKNKLINTTHFYERSVLEAILSFRLFPVTKENGLKVLTMLSGFSGLYISIRKNSPNQCSKYI